MDRNLQFILAKQQKQCTSAIDIEQPFDDLHFVERGELAPPSEVKGDSSFHGVMTRAYKRLIKKLPQLLPYSAFPGSNAAQKLAFHLQVYEMKTGRSPTRSHVHEYGKEGRFKVCVEEELIFCTSCKDTFFSGGNKVNIMALATHVSKCDAETNNDFCETCGEDVRDIGYDKFFDHKAKCARIVSKIRPPNQYHFLCKRLHKHIQ
jgi:hypothetical protein